MFKYLSIFLLFISSYRCLANDFFDIIDSRGDLFTVSPGAFGDSQDSVGFNWTTQKEDEARYFYREGQLKIQTLGFDTSEINIRFKDDAFKNVLIYIYNRSDCPLIRSKSQFGIFLKSIDAKISSWSGVKGGSVAKTRAGGASEFSKNWIYGPYSIALKWSASGSGSSYGANYINLFISRYEKGTKKKTISAKELIRNIVKNDNGDVFVDNLPMVDQGPKGYCAVATAARVLRYYGHETDMHRLANLAGTTDAGTNTTEMFSKMRRLSTIYHTKMIELNKFKVSSFISEVKKYNSLAKKNMVMRASLDVHSVGDIYMQLDPEVYKQFKSKKMKTNYKRFISHIKKYINSGVPVIWGVYLGMYKEPQLNPQASGAHLRLIIGYNEKTKEIIFSDTWGARHVFKHLGTAEAWAQTTQYAVLLKK